MATTEDRDAVALDAYSVVVTEVAERVSPSVASLRVGRRGRSGETVLRGAGSAVALTPDGFMLTSAQVVERSNRGRATFPDGRNLAFAIVSAYSMTDLTL